MEPRIAPTSKPSPLASSNPFSWFTISRLPGPVLSPISASATSATIVTSAIASHFSTRNGQGWWRCSTVAPSSVTSSAIRTPGRWTRTR